MRDVVGAEEKGGQTEHASGQPPLPDSRAMKQAAFLDDTGTDAFHPSKDDLHHHASFSSPSSHRPFGEELEEQRNKPDRLFTFFGQKTKTQKRERAIFYNKKKRRSKKTKKEALGG